MASGKVTIKNSLGPGYQFGDLSCGQAFRDGTQIYIKTYIDLIRRDSTAAVAMELSTGILRRIDASSRVYLVDLVIEAT